MMGRHFLGQVGPAQCINTGNLDGGLGHIGLVHLRRRGAAL